MRFFRNGTRTLDYVLKHAFAAAGLTLALLSVVVMTGMTGARILSGEAIPGLRFAFLGGLAGLVATSVGAVPAMALRALPQRVEDALLGGAAGMMLAAGVFSLLLPGLEAGALHLGNKGAGAAVVVLGMFLGVFLMLGIESFLPHEHAKSGPSGLGYERYDRICLFVFAIAVHNLPEGMAIGVGFSQGDMGIGLPLTTAIALQDIPEGLAVALALRAAGLTPGAAVVISAATGVLELLGAPIGVALSSGLPLAYPVGLGLAGGAMIFVVSHEIIPETHRNGHQTSATLGLMIGFALMMVMDTALG
ncbi:MAG: ZIP family metal transporter [Candidatus Accumulibacter sp.]|jgi:ZIP family zinc transporter|nr:ZIP family metal transporter [Accumulibacter sp.]